MNYSAKTVSNRVLVNDPDAVLGICDAFNLRFQYEVHENKFKLYGNDTFDVYDNDTETYLTEEFLATLSFFLQEHLSITSIGHTGNRHQPDAVRYRVEGTELISETFDDTTVIDLTDYIDTVPEEIRNQYLPVQHRS